MRQKVCSSCDSWLPTNQFYCLCCGQPIAPAPDGPALEPDEPEVMEAHEEIRLDELSASDYLVIRTHNNQYRFMLLEPEQGYGLLSGGALGGRPIQAILLGTVCADGPSALQNHLALRTGLSAVFHLDVAQGNKRMATSPITALTRIRGGKTTQSRPALSI
ncbi:MAG TPA: hypothetical protein VNO70_13670 [Blastocatellia bacterium]|nr:hypothetical protein [Blastocatellia bacterium]